MEALAVPGLLPELAPYVFTQEIVGLSLSAPLVKIVGWEVTAQHYGVTPAELANWWHDDKRASTDLAWARRDWESYVWLHERPFRPLALIRALEAHGASPWKSARLTAALCELVGDIWEDTEFPHQLEEEWRWIFETLATSRRSMMTSKERSELRKLPEMLTIWRGVAAEDDEHASLFGEGWSWTLDRGKAEWFARRFSHRERPFLAEAAVSKRQAYALKIGRNEREIVIDPASIVFTVEELPEIPCSLAA